LGEVLRIRSVKDAEQVHNKFIDKYGNAQLTSEINSVTLFTMFHCPTLGAQVFFLLESGISTEIQQINWLFLKE
jgi:hypothetical protein